MIEIDAQDYCASGPISVDVSSTEIEGVKWLSSQE